MKSILTSIILMLPTLLFAQGGMHTLVRPLIGSGGHGHVFVGASVPFGMVQAGPTQYETGWDWCSGYHYDGTRIVGFAQQHLSGTGCSDLGDIAIMPVTRDTELTRDGLATPFSHNQERALEPWYYSVNLPQAKVEVTAQRFAACYRISGSRLLAVDLKNAIGNQWTDCHLEQCGDNVLWGHRTDRGWVSCKTVYFCIQFNSRIRVLEEHDGIWRVELERPEYEAHVGISYTSREAAQRNIGDGGRDFDAIMASALHEWEQAMNRVQATFCTEQEAVVFSTALFHTMIAPMTFGNLGEECEYTTFSLWDTYRASSPLSTLLFPEMQPAIARSMVGICDQQGYLPVWHLMGGETNCMVGSPGVIVLADIVLKGFDVDRERCFQAIKSSLAEPGRGIPYMNEFGYVPCNLWTKETVAKTLEYGIAFWAGARVAEMLGHTAEQRHWDWVAQAYRRIYDDRVGYFRGRRAVKDAGYKNYYHDTFRSLKDFNPCHQTEDYTEGNPWQYLFLVPHDVLGMVELLGGRERFMARLDSLFEAPSDLNDDAYPDISGLIGQYAHGNEPSHHIIYMYNMLGEQERGCRLLRRVMNEMYNDRPEGLCGNEDCGQMSAWYVMSAMGLYQVEPAGGRYYFGSPTVKEATIQLPGGKTLRIVAHHNSPKRITVERVLWNGRQLDTNYIMHQELAQGGTLEFYMK